MIKKNLIHLFVLIGVFLMVWGILFQVNWIRLFSIKQAGKSTEEKLGGLFWSMIQKSEKEISDPEVRNPLDTLLTRICEFNEINRDKIKLHITHNGDINAIALPGYHLVIFKGLIMETQNSYELCGVIAHELAHMELGHIMKKMIKEVGLSILLSMVTGNGNPEMAQKVLKTLTSSVYDRELERKADLQATDYLINSDIPPEHFANLLYRLSIMEPEITRHLVWVNSHPNLKKRAEYIIEYSKDRLIEEKEILQAGTWEMFIKILKGEEK